MNPVAMSFLVFAVVGICILLATWGERIQRNDYRARYVDPQPAPPVTGKSLGEQWDDEQAAQGFPGIFDQTVPDIDWIGKPPEIRPLIDEHGAPRLTARIRRAGYLTDWDVVGECRDVPPELPAPKEG